MPLKKGMIVLCEKPVGSNLKTAKRIVETLDTLPCTVKYIDHYLGKGILDSFEYLHLANPLLRNSWTTKHIEEITVYMKEKMTARHRAEYYDQTGVVRDVVQNHGLQLLAHTLATGDRAKIIKGFNVTSCKLAQYTPYHSTKKVATYADITLSHKQWNKTRFRIIAGKGLDKKYTAVHIKMRQECPTDLCPVADTIILELYPTPRVRLQMYTGGMKVAPIDVPLSITLTQQQAYRNILLSLPNNVVGKNEIMAQWRVVEPCLERRVTTV